jgi:twitching motility protein PilU
MPTTATTRSIGPSTSSRWIAGQRTVHGPLGEPEGDRFAAPGESAREGKLAPAVEVLLNSYHVQELVERGDIPALKEAMEQSLAPGSQTFEQALFKLYRADVITLEEALSNADSPTNLSWLINNFEAAPAPRRDDKLSTSSYELSESDPSSASFKEFSLSLHDADEQA